MPDSKTWVVECYVPDTDDAAVQRAADQAAAAAERLGGRDGGIEYLGALVMAVDEVVLHTFRASDPDLVRQASTAAELAFDRVIESVEVFADSQPRPDGGGISMPAPLLQPKEVPS